jgi:hypothetical protein
MKKIGIYVLLVFSLALSSAEAQQGSDSDFQVVDAELFPAQLVANDTGSHVCLFGKPTAAVGEDPRSAFYGPPTDLHIVDLETGEITRRAPMVGEVRHALVTKKYLFWVPTTVNVLYRLPLSRDGDVRELPMQEAIVDCFEIGTDRIAVVFARGETSHVEVLHQDSLKVNEECPISDMKIYRYTARGDDRFQRLGDGEYFLSQRVIDQATGQTKCLASKWYGLVELIPAEQNLPRVGSGVGAYHWRRNVSDRGVAKRSGPQLFNWESKQWDVSKVRPIAASLHSVDRHRRRNYTVQLHEMVFGRTLRTETVPKVSEIDARGAFSMGKVLFAGDQIVVSVDHHIYYKSIADKSINETLEPLRLLHPATAIATVNDVKRYPLQTKGGRGTVKYTLNFESPHVVLDQDKHELTIDWPALWSDYLKALSSGKDSYIHRDLNPANQTDFFWESFGFPLEYDRTKLKGEQLIVALTICIRATDQSGQDDGVVVTTLAVAPKEELKTLIEVGHRKYVERQEGEDRRRAAAANPLTERIATIEERLERIEKLLQKIADEGESKGSK